MNASELNILEVKNDPYVVTKDGIDSYGRYILYSKYVKNFFIVTRTYTPNPPLIKPRANLFIYPLKPPLRVSYALQGYLKARTILQQWKIDVIISQDPFECGWIGSLLKKEFGVPLNVGIRANVLDNWDYLKEKPYYLIFNFIAKRVIRYADCLDVATSLERENLISRYSIPEEKVWFSPTPINFNGFLNAAGEEVRKNYLAKGYQNIALFVGRIEAQKDLPTLLKAARIVLKELPRTAFLIVGEGSKLRRLKILAKELGIEENIFFLGRLPYSVLPNYYAASDIFVITSTYEGNPKVIQEASVAKTPVVSTNFVGAYDVIIPEETGIIVPKREPQLFAQRVISLLKTPSLRKRMGEAARERVLKEFATERTLKRYLERLEFTAKTKSIR
jgi:glycosyltransferase involved in cell wall biosynthesis